jgi:type II secretory ATPase GspE/PulE/Tfp pilus assembly ATPase PilB-like protein
MTDELRQIITEGYNMAAMQGEIQRQKFVTLRQDGMLKVLQGLTTVEEVLRVTTE